MKMRRLGRRLLNAMTILMLLLGITTAVFWIRSHWVIDTLVESRPRPAPPNSGQIHTHLFSHDGHISVGRNWMVQETPQPSGWQWMSMTAPPEPPSRDKSFWNRIGFGTNMSDRHWSAGMPTHTSQGGVYIFDAWDVTFPYWVAFILTMTWPAVWFCKR